MSFLLLLPDTFLSDDWQSLDFLFALIIYAINSLLRPLGTWSKKRLIVCLVSFPSNPPLLLHNSKSSWRRRGNWHNKKCLLEAAVLRSLRVSDREKQLDYQKKKKLHWFLSFARTRTTRELSFSRFDKTCKVIYSWHNLFGSRADYKAAVHESNEHPREHLTQCKPRTQQTRAHVLVNTNILSHPQALRYFYSFKGSPSFLLLSHLTRCQIV